MAKKKKTAEKKKRQRKLPSILTAQELTALVKTADNAYWNAKTPKKKDAAYRDWVMIQTGRYAGLRVSELVKLNVGDLDFEGRRIKVIAGKGNKDRNVSMAKKLVTILRDWIGQHKSGKVFPSCGGRQMSERTFHRRLVALGKKAGIAQIVHPHLLRHLFATSLLQNGSSLSNIQHLLGHSDIRTTAFYLHVDTSRLNDDVDRL